MYDVGTCMKRDIIHPVDIQLPSVRVEFISFNQNSS